MRSKWNIWEVFPHGKKWVSFSIFELNMPVKLPRGESANTNNAGHHWSLDHEEHVSWVITAGHTRSCRAALDRATHLGEAPLGGVKV